MKPLSIIVEARGLTYYPLGKPGFSGGTENYVRHLARGLASLGHHVDVVTPDLEHREQRGEREWWHGPDAFPIYADVVVAVPDLQHIESYSADLLILASNQTDPWLGHQHTMAEGIDGFALFSEAHRDLLIAQRPTVDPERCFVTGLGVEQEDYGYWAGRMGMVPGRILYANDATNGLWHVLDVFAHVKAQVPEASLHVAYDFPRQFETWQWQAHSLAQMLWECKQRIERTPDVVSLGALERADLVREQLECAVHVMPQDSPNPTTTIWGLTAMECAAAGAALVMADNPGYREVFGSGATLLPVPGTFRPDMERRIDAQDWADVVVALMRDTEKWQAASARARHLAEQHTWERVYARWGEMLAALLEKVPSVV